MPVLNLPARSDTDGPSFVGAYRNYSLPHEQWQRLKSFSQAEGGTIFTSVLSAFAAVFSRYSTDGELVLGTSIAGRNRQSFEELVGMLTRMLPLRLRADGHSSFRELYELVRGTFGDALRNVDFPYEELVQELQRTGRAQGPNLFDVMIEFEQFTGSDKPPLGARASTGLQVTPFELTLHTSVFPVNIMLAEQAATLEAVIRFDSRLFDEHTIDKLWAAFTSLLEAALGDPSAPLEKVLLLSEQEMPKVPHRARLAETPWSSTRSVAPAPRRGSRPGPTTSRHLRRSGRRCWESSRSGSPTGFSTLAATRCAPSKSWRVSRAGSASS